MREILFRGKCNEIGKYNGQWIEGHYGEDEGRNEIFFSTKIGIVGYSCEPESIGQYTGLTDNNGKKIFEGDIVAIPPNMSRKSTIGVVKFGDYKTPPYGVDKTNRGFYIRWYYENEAIEEMLRRDIVFWFNYSHVDISIIGNIHDNPELLEVEE